MAFSELGAAGAGVSSWWVVDGSWWLSICDVADCTLSASGCTLCCSKLHPLSRITAPFPSRRRFFTLSTSIRYSTLFPLPPEVFAKGISTLSPLNTSKAFWVARTDRRALFARVSTWGKILEPSSLAKSAKASATSSVPPDQAPLSQIKVIRRMLMLPPRTWLSRCPRSASLAPASLQTVRHRGHRKAAQSAGAPLPACGYARASGPGSRPAACIR